ncbi:MAG: hypothetical protein ACFFCW_46500, partial [Candidatus Hodarchaeota archaeon]
ALLRLHVNNEMADDYYDGIFTMNGINMQWTYIKEFRFQIDFEYRGGLNQAILGIHSHLMGDGKDYYGNPSCEDLNSIPLVPGSTS